MKRPLDQVRFLAEEYKCPICFCGDLFDRHNPPPEAINFAIENLPVMYGIPGQHDLPYHRYADIKRSAYWTLVEAGKVINLNPGEGVGTGMLRLWGFPWGFEVTPLENPHSMAIEVAVIHSFIWTNTTGYEGAPEESRLSKWRERLRGYDVAAFGDNHKGFISTKGDTKICNCGGFIRRKIDEIGYRPGIGLLYESGKLERHYLDVSEDVFAGESNQKGLHNNREKGNGFVTALGSLGDTAINFQQAIEQAMNQNGVVERQRNIILEAMG